MKLLASAIAIFVAFIYGALHIDFNEALRNKPSKIQRQIERLRNVKLSESDFVDGRHHRYL